MNAMTMKFSAFFVSLLLLLVPSHLLAAEETEPQEKNLSIGFIYISPVGEEGFSYSHEIARRELEKHFPAIHTYYKENIAEGAAAEQALFDMTANKTNIIIATSYGYLEPMLEAAAQNPDTIFLHCSGYRTSGNLSSYFGRMYEPRYLTGMVAGAMTKTNTIGYVASFPIPEVVRGINAFTLGARSVNPNAVVRVAWTKTWFDPITEKEEAMALIAEGADVLTHHQESAAVQEAGYEKGVYTIGYQTDASDLYPETHLVAAIWNWYPFYKNMVQKVEKKEWASGFFWPGMKSGIVDISRFGGMVPQHVQKTVLLKKQQIIDGSFYIFKGPIYDQSGEKRVADNESLQEKDLVRMDWFVLGVDGDIEK